MGSPRLKWRDFLLVMGVSILLALSFNSSNPNGIPLVPESVDMGAVKVVDGVGAMKIFLQALPLEGCRTYSSHS